MEENIKMEETQQQESVSFQPVPEIEEEKPKKSKKGLNRYHQCSL